MALRNLVHFFCKNPFIQKPTDNLDDTKEKVFKNKKRKESNDKGDDTKRISSPRKKMNQSYFAVSNKELNESMAPSGRGGLDHRAMHQVRDNIFLQVKAKQPGGKEENGDSSLHDQSLSKGNISKISKRSMRRPKKVYNELNYLPNHCFEIERVVNWEKRIQGYSEKSKNRYKTAQSKLKELRDLFADKADDWKVTIDNKKPRLFCEQRTSKRGMQCARI